MTDSKSTLSRRAAFAEGETIITALMAKTIENPDLISLAAGFVDFESLPVDFMKEAVDAVMTDDRRAREALQYGTTMGYKPLRHTLAERHAMLDGHTLESLNLSADDVVVTAGSNQILHLVGETLVDPDDIILCAAPSYFVYLGTLSNFGARAVGVASDPNGILPDALEETLRERKASGELPRIKAIYITTYFDNPSGVTTSTERRRAIVEIVKRWSKDEGRPIYVVDDAAYRELRYEGEDLPSLRSFDPEGETVITAGTFSKTFSPGIRIGWGILPHALREAVLAQKGGIDFGTANFNQVVMHEVLVSGRFDEHLERLRASYRPKLATALAAAEESLVPRGARIWVRPQGGLYVWIVLPEGVDAGLESRFFNEAVREGVLYVPGEYCYPREGFETPRNVLRLSFGVASREQIRRGIALLGTALEHM